MKSIIDLYTNKEVLTLTIEAKNYEIKLQGTTEKPYFCGKDVCNILGYSDIKSTLLKNVKLNHKLMLKEVAASEAATSEPQTSVIKLGVDTKNISYNDGKAIYISEPGLYSLIMKSKVKFAETFQDFVYEEILPSIRKFGSYKINSDLIESKKLLSIKDEELKQKELESEEKLKLQELELKKESEEKLKIELKQKELESEEKLKKELKLQSEKDERYTNRLKEMVVTMKSKQKDQIIYIATTKAYAKQNRFKVGGVKSKSLLKSRLSTYNSGRPAGDKMYYAFITDTVNYNHLEQRINFILGDHKDTKEAEVYILHYNHLQPFIEWRDGTLRVPS